MQVHVHPRSLALAVVFLYMSYLFVRYQAKGDFDDALVTLRSYSSLECPANFSLYFLQHSDHLIYRIQTEERSSSRTDHYFRRCERKAIEPCDDSQFGSDNCENDGLTYSPIASVHLGTLDTACSKVEYSTLESEPSDVTSQDLTKPSGALDYLLEVVGSSTGGLPKPKTRGDEWTIQTLLRGIFPGTLWCGFGNIADDTYSKLGLHAATDACCRTHDLCRPMIRAYENRFHVDNPSILPISHCSCDQELHSCLKQANTTAARHIGRIFFNVAKMRCFDFDMKKVCNMGMLGVCMSHVTKCVGSVKESNNF